MEGGADWLCREGAVGTCVGASAVCQQAVPSPNGQGFSVKLQPKSQGFRQCEQARCQDLTPGRMGKKGLKDGAWGEQRAGHIQLGQAPEGESERSKGLSGFWKDPSLGSVI